MYDDDIIAAIATGYAVAAIGIVRVTGRGSLEILEKIFTKKPPYEHRKIHYGHITDSNGEVIDEVLVSVFKAPNSYTGEDSFEISCHGGLSVLNFVLERVFEAGARMAQPGEFTKRAFLNGKIDLSQAEAVEKIISSKSKRALFIAQRQLAGKFSSRIEQIREKILFLMAENEVIIDHPEEDISSIETKEKVDMLVDIKKQLKSILKSSQYGDMIFEGVVLAIIGKPNVGKSSLLNILTGTSRSIVTDIPGTTRDVVSETFNIKGIPCTILDTAGIRETNDVIENIGVQRSKKALKEADIVIAMFDASNGLDERDVRIINYAVKYSNKVVGVVNKTDIKKANFRLPFDKVVEVSCKNEAGIDKLEDTIADLVINLENDSDIVSLNANQKDSLKKGINICDKLIEDFQRGVDPALIGVDFISLADSLDDIVGKISNEDMLDTMFKKFCIGK